MQLTKKIHNALYTGDNKIKMLDQRYLPRWIVILLDIFICCTSLIIVYFAFQKIPVNFNTFLSIPLQGLIVLSVNIFFFFVFRTFSGIIRHSTFTDILKMAFSAFATTFIVLLGNEIVSYAYGFKIYLTTSVLLYMLLSFTLMLLFRIAVKETYQFLKNSSSGTLKKKVAIIGVDDNTISLGKALTTESNLPFHLVGFLTENMVSKRYKILNKPVIPIKENFSEVISKLGIDGVLIVSGSLTGKKKNQIVEECLAHNIEVFNVPTLQRWNKKADIKNYIKPIQIEDLLERESINIDNDLIKKDLENKTILVTGGVGSIGRELVLQLAEFNPKLVVILDQAESALYEFELFLEQNYPSLNFITELANISNMYRLESIFNKYEFKMVYHAAAYKHVPLIERNPHEAVYVNILGTVNLAILCISFHVEKFVMVSTDKAVNPTNVMGASKRVAEMYVQSLQNEKGVTTRFITTRFGNVLGSNGSVIPYFRKQISQGGPVTVTHKDIIRYFMTISEACQLLLQAGTMGNGGEIFVFDMGEPVKILKLAEKMIRLSGMEPYVDIDIKITGLRPGEKLYEELLNDSSIVLPTHHPKIMIAQAPYTNFKDIKVKVKELIKTATRYKDNNVIKLLKEIVPEYVSNTSLFESHDIDEAIKKE